MVRDGCVKEAVETVERALGSIQPIALRYEVPQPTGHGHWQAFYRLENTSPLLLIDLVIMEESHPTRFLEVEIHGTPVVHFDRQGIVRQPPCRARRRKPIRY